MAAAALYRSDGDPAAATNGFLASLMAAQASEVVEVWTENWAAFELFSFMQTQWRMGGFGATGLDYNVLFHKMDRMRLSADDYDVMEADIRVMEHEAMTVMSEKQ
jgi:hypothetical protein